MRICVRLRQRSLHRDQRLPPEILGITVDFSVDLAVLPVDFPAAVSAEAAEEAGKIRIKKR